jgi:GTPase
MASANFIDHIKINCKSGAGGAGSVHFRREKFIPKGGPDGGDGGRGGHIILRGNKNLWTLLHLRYQRHVKAENGQSGGGQQKSGASGKDVFIEVPLGTVAKDAETGEVFFEVTEHGQEDILLEGGMGGRGNVHFKSSVNQSPRYAQPGIPGKEAWVVLELKLLADVGLVGFPNAGKSTLLSVLSAAKPKIASYAFTTLKPNLGMVFYRDQRSFVMADIPGIIEDAHKGKGLGLRFLRHIERNSLLLFTIPGDSESVAKEYEILLGEIRKYNPELLDKPRMVAITKCDLIDEEIKNWVKNEIPPDLPYVFISSVTQIGLQELKDMIWELLHT